MQLSMSLDLEAIDLPRVLTHAFMCECTIIIKPIEYTEARRDRGDRGCHALPFPAVYRKWQSRRSFILSQKGHSNASILMYITDRGTYVQALTDLMLGSRSAVYVMSIDTPFIAYPGLTDLYCFEPVLASIWHVFGDRWCWQSAFTLQSCIRIGHYTTHAATRNISCK